MAWWHDHSADVIDALRHGRQIHDDPEATTDAINERVHREHLNDSPELVRHAFNESWARLLAALDPLTEDELFAPDRWPSLDGEALAEMILWDTARHYEAHRSSLESISG